MHSATIRKFTLFLWIALSLRGGEQLPLQWKIHLIFFVGIQSFGRVRNQVASPQQSYSLLHRKDESFHSYSADGATALSNFTRNKRNLQRKQHTRQGLLNLDGPYAGRLPPNCSRTRILQTKWGSQNTAHADSEVSSTSQFPSQSRWWYRQVDLWNNRHFTDNIHGWDRPHRNYCFCLSGKWVPWEQLFPTVEQIHPIFWGWGSCSQNLLNSYWSLQLLFLLPWGLMGRRRPRELQWKRAFITELAAEVRQLTLRWTQDNVYDNRLV